MGMLVALIAVGVFQQTTQNYFCKNLFQNKSDNFIYTLVLYAVAGLSTFIAGGCAFGKVATFTIIDGFFYGLCLTTELFCVLQAYKCGSMSLTTMMIVASIIVPVIPSWIIWGDPITWQQVAGIIVMFIAIALIINLGKDVEKGSISWKWFGYAIVAFLGSGFAAICEKSLTESPYAAQSNEFIIIGCISAVVLMAIFLVFNTKKEPITIKPSVKVGIPVVLIGIFNWLICSLTISILQVLPASVVFTVNNGARLMILTIIDVIFFKEKLSKSQYAGLVLGIIGIVLLSI